MMARRVAVIDTGTNSTRLMVADVEGGQVREIARRTEITRLGEDVDKTGRLSPSAMQRVRNIFSAYRKIASYLEADESVIIATSSVRDALDGEEFIAGLARKAAYEYRVLSGSEEASLSFAGATMGQPPTIRIMILDVGGGSTEIAAGVSGIPDYALSLDIGCVRLTEAFIMSDPVGGGELAAITTEIDSALERHVDREHIKGIDRTLAVAGTVTALAAIDLELDEYDRSRVHGHLLTKPKIEALMQKLAAMTVGERREISTLAPGRADVIVAGTLILLRVLEYAGVEEVYVSERDILDGAALRLIERRL